MNKIFVKELNASEFKYCLTFQGEGEEEDSFKFLTEKEGLELGMKFFEIAGKQLVLTDDDLEDLVWERIAQIERWKADNQIEKLREKYEELKPKWKAKHLS